MMVGREKEEEGEEELRAHELSVLKRAAKKEKSVGRQEWLSLADRQVEVGREGEEAGEISV